MIRKRLIEEYDVNGKPTSSKLIEEEYVLDLNALYESRCQELISAQYPPNEENKVVREYLAYPNDTAKQQAFAAYNDFVEGCKQQAYQEIYGNQEGQ